MVQNLDRDTADHITQHHLYGGPCELDIRENKHYYISLSGFLSMFNPQLRPLCLCYIGKRVSAGKE